MHTHKPGHGAFILGIDSHNFPPRDRMHFPVLNLHMSAGLLTH